VGITVIMPDRLCEDTPRGKNLLVFSPSTGVYVTRETITIGISLVICAIGLTIKLLSDSNAVPSTGDFSTAPLKHIYSEPLYPSPSLTTDPHSKLSFRKKRPSDIKTNWHEPFSHGSVSPTTQSSQYTTSDNDESSVTDTYSMSASDSNKGSLSDSVNDYSESVRSYDTGDEQSDRGSHGSSEDVESDDGKSHVSSEKDDKDDGSSYGQQDDDSGLGNRIKSSPRFGMNKDLFRGLHKRAKVPIDRMELLDGQFK